MTSHGQPIRAVVFDWAGTIVDHGSLAPVEAFRELLRRHGVPISVDEARGPMGMEKRDHIASILALPRVAEEWKKTHGRETTAADLAAMYDEFLTIQLEVLPHHADVIPGALETLAHCRQRGLRIGSSSGYARPLMDSLVRIAARLGLELDAVVSASEVSGGRPAPWMIFRNMELLQVYPPSSVVTVDDTIVGIAAGLNAGTWSVGVIESGNMFGLARPELEQLDVQVRRAKSAACEQAFLAAGAHYAIASVADLPAVLDEIAVRQSRGEAP